MNRSRATIMVLALSIGQASSGHPTMSSSSDTTESASRGPATPAPCRQQASAVPIMDDLLEELRAQGVATPRVLGFDHQGIPALCSTTHAPLELSQSVGGPLPAGTRAWATIPSVIRDDGVDTFTVEINVNGPVNGVTMTASSSFVTPPAPWPVVLVDDGTGADRLAGDFIFTAGGFRFNLDSPFTLPATYAQGTLTAYPDSAPGVNVFTAGIAAIEETDGTMTRFLKDPQVGFLDSTIRVVPTLTLAPDVVVSPHLINIMTSDYGTQRYLHVSAFPPLTTRIYQLLPDAFDFLTLFSTNKVERIPRTSSSNFITGIHGRVQQEYTGASSAPFDSSDVFGSAGRLLGINGLDTGTRGIGASNATHEMTHQWAAQLDSSFGLSAGSHYSPFSNAASLVGGFLWSDNGDGTYTLDCDEGQNGAHRAPPFDKYMMGLIPGSEVAPLHTYDNQTNPNTCGEISCFGGFCSLIDNPAISVTIADIQAVQGVRTPTPATAQKDFVIGFVAESHERLLTPTEMTFYDILARHYTRTLPAGNPDPDVGMGWVPITRFFGSGSTWSSTLPVSGGTAAGGVTGLLLTMMAGGEIELSWDPSCNGSDGDFEIYEGPLGDFQGHKSRFCSTGGATSGSFVPSIEDSFYLIVPRSVDREGSYGLDSDGNERSAGDQVCLLQSVATCS